MLKRVVLSLVLSIPQPAIAVSCGKPLPVKQAHAAADNVFSAHVEQITIGNGFGREDARLARLRVLQVWKGNLERGDVVTSSAEDSVHFTSDGFVPVTGSNVLVHTHGPQPFMLSSCSRTSALEHSRDLHALQRLARAGAR